MSIVVRTAAQNTKIATINFRSVFFSFSSSIALKYVFTASHGFSLSSIIHSRNVILSFMPFTYILEIMRNLKLLYDNIKFA